jgi:uncharacterized delta-60 repeat protein
MAAHPTLGLRVGDTGRLPFPQAASDKGDSPMWFFSRKIRHSKPTRRLPTSRRPGLEILEDRCLLSAGVLDPTFGSGGIVTTAFPAGRKSTPSAVAYAVAVQSDSKIVLAGYATSASSSGFGFGVARYTPSGTLDSSFGSGGRVVTFIGKYGDSHAQAEIIQPDGKIVAVGQALVFEKQTSTGLFQNYAFAVVRYNPNGTLDTSFGGTGIVLTDLNPNSAIDTAYGVALQADGRIVVAGITSTPQSPLAAVVRYNPDGTLDKSFGGTGIVLTNTGPTDGAWSVLVQPSDGKIVVSSDRQSNGEYFVLLRYNPDGSLDPTFGTGGLAAIPYTSTGDFGRDRIALQNGMVVLAGTARDMNNIAHFIAVRVNADGTLDTTFGQNGYATTDLGGYLVARGIAIQGDGSIVIGGISNGAPDKFALERYTSNGALDPSFGSGGVVMTPVGTADPESQALAIQPNGDILLAGYDYPTSGSNEVDFAVARYLPSQPEIGSFTASPNPVTSGSSTTLTASNITDGNPNSTITQVAFFYYDSTGAQHVLGYGTQTSPGVWTLNYTVNLASGTYTIYAQAEDSYGVFGDPFALTLTVQ